MSIDLAVDRSSCSLRSRVDKGLEKYFHFSTLRPGQFEAVEPILQGKDVFVRMATGSGKSLCMFLPPLIVSLEAAAVVVSPLNGLMEQQVSQLNSIGVSATIATKSNYDTAAQGMYRFVFMCPEIAVQTPWRGFFSTPFAKKHLVLLAVDEAHCITDWGESFRPAFEKLGGLRALTNVPFMALTATASAETQDVIVKSLHLLNPVIVSRSLDRPNIYMSVGPIKTLTKDMAGVAEMLQRTSSSDIPKILLFVQTKNMACKVYGSLISAAFSNSYVGMYHASLTHLTKERIRADFQGNTKLRCLVATVAFGMGMDIGDIRLVIVYGAPGGVNELHQLCGRAGRDRSPARAHIFYSPKQKKIDSFVKDFCTDTENCRRRRLLRILGSGELESTIASADNPCCDVCHPGLPDHIACLEPLLPPPTRTRRKRVRVASCEQEEKLVELLTKERDNFLSNHPSFLMIGVDFVFPSALIRAIYLDVSFITSVEYIKEHYNLRPELCDKLFAVIDSVVPTNNNKRQRT